MTQTNSPYQFTSEVGALLALPVVQELELSTYSTILIALVILKELPNLTELLKSAAGNKILDLITKFLVMGANYIRAIKKLTEDNEHIKNNREKLDAIIAKIDLFRETPKEIAATQNRLNE